MRRENAGIRPLFPLIEACLGLRLISQEMMDYPAVVSLENCACDLVAIDNVRSHTALVVGLLALTTDSDLRT